MAAERDLLTVNDIAERLGITAQAVYALRYRGSFALRGYRIGGRVLFRRDEFEAWLDAQREPNREPLAG